MLRNKKIEKLLERITGFSTPFLGISWEPAPNERKIIYKLIVELSNRRLLERTHGGFWYKAALNSLDYIRTNITTALIELGPDSRFKGILEIALDDFKTFQTVIENEFAANNFVDDMGPSGHLIGAWYTIRERGGLILGFLCYANEIEPPDRLKWCYDFENKLLK
ncbi:MAG: hypothetical protein Q8J88_11815 [Bacteroidales bacterium]|nr:hypothetical protein [Bacteroidales bacterium]